MRRAGNKGSRRLAQTAGAPVQLSRHSCDFTSFGTKAPRASVRTPKLPAMRNPSVGRGLQVLATVVTVGLATAACGNSESEDSAGRPVPVSESEGTSVGPPDEPIGSSSVTQASRLSPTAPHVITARRPRDRRTARRGLTVLPGMRGRLPKMCYAGPRPTRGRLREMRGADDTEAPTSAVPRPP